MKSPEAASLRADLRIPQGLLKYWPHLGISLLVLALSPLAQAATVTMTANTNSGVNGFNPTSATNTGWPSVPVAGTDYYNPSFILRTGTTSALSTATFAGNSLTIGSGSATVANLITGTGTAPSLLYKGTPGGTITVNNLILNAGAVADNPNGGTSSMTLAGNITLATGGGVFTLQSNLNTSKRSMTVSANIQGSGPLYMANSGTTTGANSSGTTAGEAVVTLSGTNTYTGNTTIGSSTTDTTSGWMLVNVSSSSSLGSSSSTSAVSVLANGLLTLNGTTNMGLNQSLWLDNDLSTLQHISLSYTGSMTIAALSLDGGSTFVSYGTYGAFGSGATNPSDFFIGAGLITVVPEPSSVSLAIALGLIFIAVGKHRHLHRLRQR